MRISSFKIVNYKSFLETDEIKLTSGFNVIVGRNNVGKTALAEALSLQYGDKPHRSLETIPYRGAKPANLASQFHMSWELGKDEFLSALKDHLPSFDVPMFENESVESQKDRFLRVVSGESIIIQCTLQSGGFSSAYLTEYGKPHRVEHILRFRIERRDSQPTYVQNLNGDDNFVVKLVRILSQRIYFFRAERLNVGQSQIGINSVLKPDASNLPEVLHLLRSSNSSRFSRLVQYIREIFPEITDVTIPPMQGNPANAQILLWTIDPATERDDLAMPLSESGTGIGQVLAILYVVLTSDFSRSIIIDEPQSFLHPGAIRKLLDILKQNYSQHQYIITTHSPTVISSTAPQTLLLVQKEGAKSQIEIIDPTEIDKQKLFLNEVGARLSDVFGSDNILWVEGRTEELCFPLILSEVARQPTLGTSIVGVIQTGDLEGKDSKRIFEIYDRLSQGRGILPPAIGFIFDQEGRSKDEQNDIRKRSKGKVSFLPRRMYENYLLNLNAIAEVIAGIENFRETPIRVEKIAEWLGLHKWDKKYFKQVIDEKERNELLWFEQVDGANLLNDLFKELSDNRVIYDKIEYGVPLTNWLIKNAPADLQELADFIVSVLEQKKEPAQAS